ncbi:MAG: FixH family protein [Anaerolineae bacterium]|nr:FixH family protein [Anaerolineae bacterium]
MKKILWLMLLVFLIAGCRNSLTQDNNSPFRVTVYTDPILPHVGDATVIIRLSAAPDNTPINDAQKIAVKADMTHAGMTPVLAETTQTGEDGYYRIPITFTMAGDWVLDISATLADGTVINYATSIAGIANVVPNFQNLDDCETPDEDATESVPDCLIDVTESPLDFGIAP